MKNRFIPILILILTTFLGYGNLTAADKVQVPCNPEIFPTDSMTIQVSDCTVDAKFCIPVPLADQANHQYLVNGIPYVGTMMGCDFERNFSYTYDNFNMMINPGPYTISWMVNGFNITGSFTDIAGLVTFMQNNDPSGNWMHIPAPSLIVGGNPNSTYGDAIIMAANNVDITLGPSIGTEAQGTLIDLPEGTHEILVIDIANVCDGTIIVTVACITPEEIPAVVQIGETDTLCIDLTELTGTLAGVSSFCPTGADGNVSFSFVPNTNNTCVAYTGNSVGQDSFCMVACDVAGFCDTTVLIVQVPGAPAGSSNVIFDTLIVNDIDVHCLNTTMLGSEPFITRTLCDTGNSFDFMFDATSNCIFYQAMNTVETDSFCIEICGSTTCDTTTFIVTALPDPTVVNGPILETVYINQQGSFCPDLSVLPGNIDTIYNICPTISGGFVMFTPDLATNCMNYEAIDLGSDTACVVIRDNLGNFDTTRLVIRVLEPSPEVKHDTLFLGNTGNYCVDTGQLAGNIDTIYNKCDSLSGNSVDFQIITGNLCFDAPTLDLGTDTACVIICDEFGVCDETTFIVTVLDPSLSPPVASNDVDTTSLNRPMVINYCENDVIPNGTLESFGLLDIANGGVGPTNGGSVIFNTDCTISYVPQTGFCGGVDSFSYTICNTAGCDTATVAVFVECLPGTGEFEIHNAFSPNGDDVNDFFQIDGIENFNDHLLCIYNRWGNQVLKTENYQNDWQGTWEGTDLPSGTYFYVFDDGNGNKLSGYIQIMR